VAKASYRESLESSAEAIRLNFDSNGLVGLPTLKQAHLIAYDALNDLVPALWESHFLPHSLVAKSLFLAIPAAAQWEVMLTLSSLIIGYIFADRPKGEDEADRRADDIPPTPPAHNWREHHMFEGYKRFCTAYIELDSASEQLSPLAQFIKPAVNRAKEKETADYRQQMDTRPRRKRGRKARPDGDGT
jgi:hypothetical protein